jgi:hypothetical protein
MTSNKHNLPSDFDSDTDKRSDEYGIQIARVIDEDWYSTGRLGNVRDWITRNRSYSRGEQGTDYRAMIEGTREGAKMDVKTHKIDYTQTLKILNVFKDTVINAIDESLFKPRAEAIDIKSVNTKKDYFKKLDEDFASAEIAQLISSGIGVDISPGDLPKNEKDLSKRKLEYKPNIEIAQELAIENVMKHQRIEVIKNKMDEDLFDLGYCVAKRVLDKDSGIKMEYIDPYYHGHGDFEMEDGRDCRYQFHVKQDTITNLAKLSGGLTADEMLKLKNRAINDFKSTTAYDETLDGNRLIEHIHFVYLVSTSEIYKKHVKNGLTKYINRTKDDIEYEPSRKSKKLKVPYNTWFEGVYVPEEEILIKWSEVENQVVEGVNTPDCPFIIYAPRVKRKSENGFIRFDSSVNRAIPIVDDIQRDFFKFQQLKMELRPNTVEINVDAINQVVLNGETLPANTVLDLFFGRGVLLKNMYDNEGDPIDQAVIERNGGINNTALGFLSQEFSNSYERLRVLLGINELRDGTIRQSDRTPAKVQKVLLASSNNNTSHIVTASFNVSLMFARSISLMLKDVLNSKSLRDMYMNIIGTDNVELLDEIKNIPMHHFGVYFDFKPDDEERVSFENSLINDLNQGKINSAQYNTTRQIRNAKNAIKYLGIIIKENEELEQQRKLEAQKQQGEINAQASAFAEKSKQGTLTVEWDVKKQEILLKEKHATEGELRKAKLKELENQLQHQRDLELKQLDTNNNNQRLELLEDRKDQRVNQVATNTSKIADQKMNKKEPIDFQNQLKDIYSELLP